MPQNTTISRPWTNTLRLSSSTPKIQSSTQIERLVSCLIPTQNAATICRLRVLTLPYSAHKAGELRQCNHRLDQGPRIGQHLRQGNALLLQFLSETFFLASTNNPRKRRTTGEVPHTWRSVNTRRVLMISERYDPSPLKLRSSLILVS